MKPSTYKLIVQLTDRHLRFEKHYPRKPWRSAVAYAMKQDRLIYGPQRGGTLRTANIGRAVKLITTVHNLLKT